MVQIGLDGTEPTPGNGHAEAHSTSLSHGAASNSTLLDVKSSQPVLQIMACKIRFCRNLQCTFGSVNREAVLLGA